MIIAEKLCCNVGTVSMEVLDASVPFTRSYWIARARQCYVAIRHFK